MRATVQGVDILVNNIVMVIRAKLVLINTVLICVSVEWQRQGKGHYG